jgi:predicted ribosomally synthesized peptide with SipW-like signal peptide
MTKRVPFHARLGLAVAAIAIVAVGVAAAPLVTLARLTDSDSTNHSFTTDTLDPPTGLAATGGASIGLSWTATGDTYATGYEIRRSTTSGSGYALINTVTPRTATSSSDSPSAGTYYYVLRSYFQNWRSVDSNEASATVPGASSDTGQKPCVTTSADTGGDGDGYETSPANLCADDSVLGTDANTGTAARSASCANAANDRHRFQGFAFGLPGSVTSVSGVEIRIDEGLNNNGGTSNLCVELSWDGGTNWTTAKTVTLSGAAEATYLFGGAADTWGHSWTASQLSTANFRVRVTDATTQNTKDYKMDYLAARVVYVP